MDPEDDMGELRAAFSDPDCNDLGDGLTRFRADGREFSLDLFGFYSWLRGNKPPEDAGPYATLEVVAARIKKDCGVELNLSQANALLHAANMEFARIKKKHDDDLSWPESTAPES